MMPTSSRSGSIKYRYYITTTAHKTGHANCDLGMVRAGDLEGIIFDQLKQIFRQPELIVETWKSLKNDNIPIPEYEVKKNLVAIDTLWDHLFHNEQARLLNIFIERIDICPTGVKVQIKTHGLNKLVTSIKQLYRNRKAAEQKSQHYC